MLNESQRKWKRNNDDETRTQRTERERERREIPTESVDVQTHLTHPSRRKMGGEPSAVERSVNHLFVVCFVLFLRRRGERGGLSERRYAVRVFFRSLFVFRGVTLFGVCVCVCVCGCVRACVCVCVGVCVFALSVGLGRVWHSFSWGYFFGD